jgi:hypothetical protein
VRVSSAKPKKYIDNSEEAGNPFKKAGIPFMKAGKTKEGQRRLIHKKEAGELVSFLRTPI